MFAERANRSARTRRSVKLRQRRQRSTYDWTVADKIQCPLPALGSALALALRSTLTLGSALALALRSALTLGSALALALRSALTLGSTLALALRSALTLGSTLALALALRPALALGSTLALRPTSTSRSRATMASRSSRPSPRRKLTRCNSILKSFQFELFHRIDFRA
ncbi:hypothetical protein Pla52o_04150 [Novipirellula galeiformis]|uniref:Uncharacterized protein n=1 Tax=Novipirellula galeiformis TaxID=2528004 RepID=A0A5C6CQ05_9BACT|nr:hypothetical protein Pla52o_04150 [Novipirellula galeiformis]